MGGGPGKEGFIDAKKLIKVIKEDFEKEIDMFARVTNSLVRNTIGVVRQMGFRNFEMQGHRRLGAPGPNLGDIREA